MNHTKFLALLTMFTALTISGVAIVYSVAGLVAIFAAYPYRIAFMGTVLEVAKLVVAVWLHKYWSRATTWLKSYLAFGVVVLMVLTSVGIFGFLSKAHTEQAAANSESIAQIARIKGEIARNQAVIDRAEQKIKKTETVGNGANVNIQAQIDKEQARIDQAFTRIQQEEQALSKRTEPFTKELTALDAELKALQDALAAKDIKQAQRIAGAQPDGNYGPKTVEKIKAYRDPRVNRRQTILKEIEKIRTTNSPAIGLAKSQIEASNKRIAELSKQLVVTKGSDIDKIIDEQTRRIQGATTALDQLTEKKYELEAANRELEAEVGPIKFIAEFIYGDTERSILEKAVSWMIILIVAVFDPLAVILLVASQYTFAWWKEEKLENAKIEEKTQEKEVVTEEKTTLEAPSTPKVVSNVKLSEKEVNDLIEAETPVEEIVNKIVEDPELMADPEVQEQLDQDPELLAEVEKRILTTDGENVIVKNETKEKKGWI